MLSTTIEFMFYNKNSNLGIFVSMTFFQSNTGMFQVTELNNVFLPQNYAQ